MQQLQQMRMLQSLGQYSQLGLGGFGSPFGSGYGQVDQQNNQSHNDHLDQKNDFNKPQKPMVRFLCKKVCRTRTLNDFDKKYIYVIFTSINVLSIRSGSTIARREAAKWKRKREKGKRPQM